MASICHNRSANKLGARGNVRIDRLVIFSFALIFPFIALSPASEQRSRRRANRPPSIVSFTSSLMTIQICPFFPTSDKPEVRLDVNAIDPDGDSLNYEYSSTEGIISGTGRSVLWHLDGLPRGPHKVHVTVRDGKGGKVAGALTVTTVDASICDPPPPPCPVIKVACPDEMDQSKPFIFSVLVEGDAKSLRPSSFNWKINAGRIVKGQYSDQIEVTATGANGFDNITATVDVGGFDPSCAGTTVSCTTKIIW